MQQEDPPVTLQAMYEFRVIRLPTPADWTADPQQAEETTDEVCEELTKSSKSGRLGPILNMGDGMLLFGELTGYVPVGPKPADVLPVSAILRPV